MKKRISILLVLLMLFVLPTVGLAESNNETVIKTTQLNDELTYDKVKEMVENDDFGNLDVHKTITKEEIGLVERITIKNTLSKTSYLNDMIKEDVELYSIASVLNSGSDGSSTATLYVKSNFDKITRNGDSYAKIVSSSYKVDIHDNSFRTKLINGSLGQGGFTAIYYSGTAAYPSTYTKDFSVSYPTSGKWYETQSSADRYFPTSHSNTFVGTWAKATIERNTTGTTFSFIVRAYI